MAGGSLRLQEYPAKVVRLSCEKCGRAGQYSKQNLIARMAPIFGCRICGGRELPPKQVQYLLGHYTISMTFDICGHLFPSESNRDELTAAVRRLLA